MQPIPIPKNYKRLGPFAIDEDSVFATQEALDTYLSGGTCYAGQVVALVLDTENEAQIFKVNKDKSLGSIGSVDVDTEITENSENPVSGGAVFIGLSNKADSNHTHETDATPTQDSTKLVTSGGVFTELGKKAETNHEHILSAIKPDSNKAKKLIVVDETGNVIGYTSFDFDQIFQFGDMDVSSWLEGEQRLVLVSKSEGQPALQNAAELRDIFAPPAVESLLGDNTGWLNESKTITGENYRGEIGNPGQVRILPDGTFCWCTSSTQGTEGGGNGSSTWKRNRAVDVLDPDNNTQDRNVCDQLNPMRTGGNTDDGWDLINNTKILTIPAKWGTWWKDTDGYMYFCYATEGSNSYWWRNGTPKAIQAPINTTSHPTLTANLLAHDFTGGVYTYQAGDETSYWDQYYYDAASRSYFKKINGTQWEKLR